MEKRWGRRVAVFTEMVRDGSEFSNPPDGSGLVIWAMLGFVFTFKILTMLIVWLLCFGLEIMRHKRQKLIKVEADKLKREAFFRWAKLKYSFDLCAFAILLFWAI